MHHVRLYNAATLKAHVESRGFVLRGMAGTSFLPRRMSRGVLAEWVDVRLSDLSPQLCGDLIAVFRRRD